MKLYETTFDIDAAAADVWRVLTDTAAYGEWNPSLPAISGQLTPGSTLTMTLGMPGRPSVNVKAQIKDLEPESLFTWEGHLVTDRFFKGRREFRIAPVGENRVRFTHVERITGPFVPVFLLMMRDAPQRGHDAFNAALKQRAESR
ncbi:MAG: SRPBCC domain-containing protein [Nocardiaceae bacterium]|nr:SRPBCC domain-containing protein [Nocardiaceae bacterium]